VGLGGANFGFRSDNADNNSIRSSNDEGFLFVSQESDGNTYAQLQFDSLTTEFTSEGLRTLFLTGVPSAVNYLTVSNSATGDEVVLSAAGTDTDIGIEFHSKVAGVADNTHYVKCFSDSTEYMAVEIHAQYGGDVGTYRIVALPLEGALFRYDGSGNSTFNITTQEDTLSDITFNPGEKTALVLTTVTDAVNFLTIENDDGSNPKISATGADADINLRLVHKGDSNVQIRGTTGDHAGLQIVAPDNSITAFFVTDGGQATFETSGGPLNFHTADAEDIQFGTDNDGAGGVRWTITADSGNLQGADGNRAIKLSSDGGNITGELGSNDEGDGVFFGIDGAQFTINVESDDDIIFRTDDTTRWTIDDSAGGDLVAASGVNLVTTDEAYGVGWDGNFEVPTKNALYDKIQTISAGSLPTYALAPVHALCGGM
jgi:hypothetical protein